jgi:hypothetical protein
MIAHLWTRSAALERREWASFQRRLCAVPALVALGLLTQACCSTPSAPSAGSDPSDPGAPAAPVVYRSTLGAYKSQRPVEPRPWSEQNERVAPPAKQ